MDLTFRERRLHPVLLIRGGLALPQLLKIVSLVRRDSTEENYFKVLTLYNPSTSDDAAVLFMFNERSTLRSKLNVG
jgi:hypothetical protein